MFGRCCLLCCRAKEHETLAILASPVRTSGLPSCKTAVLDCDPHVTFEVIKRSDMPVFVRSFVHCGDLQENKGLDLGIQTLRNGCCKNTHLLELRCEMCAVVELFG